MSNQSSIISEIATEKLGVLAITFMIIAASAPLTVVAGGITTAFTVTGSIAVPIAYVALTLVLALFCFGFTSMSSYINNAGAFYAYVAQGIGRPVGVGVSIIALVSYNAMQIGIYGMLGFQVSDVLNNSFDIYISWWAVALVTIAVVGWMGVNRIDLSVKVLGVLVAAEFLVVLLFDFPAFRFPAESFTVQPILPSEFFTPNIGAVLAFSVAAFMGFEQAAIYGEEAKDPKRTIVRSTFLAVTIIGIFYALSSWALSLAIGPEKIMSGAITEIEAGPPLFFNFASEHFNPIIVRFMSALFVTSLFAAVLSFHNAVARYFFSLGREGVLHESLSKVNKAGVPWAGSVTQTIIAALVIIIFAIGGVNSEYGSLYPVITLFTWLTNTGSMGLVLLMAITSLSVIGFFYKNKFVGYKIRIYSAVISFVILSYLFYLILHNFNVLLDQSETNAVTYILPALLALSGIAGVLWGLYLKKNKPKLYVKIGYGGA